MTQSNVRECLLFLDGLSEDVSRYEELEVWFKPYIESIYPNLQSSRVEKARLIRDHLRQLEREQKLEELLNDTINTKEKRSHLR